MEILKQGLQKNPYRKKIISTKVEEQIGLHPYRRKHLSRI